MSRYPSRPAPLLRRVAIEPNPVTANRRRLLDRGENVLLGVSPFNTQFNKSY